MVLTAETRIDTVRLPPMEYEIEPPPVVGEGESVVKEPVRLQVLRFIREILDLEPLLQLIDRFDPDTGALPALDEHVIEGLTYPPGKKGRKQKNRLQSKYKVVAAAVNKDRQEKGRHVAGFDPQTMDTKIEPLEKRWGNILNGNTLTKILGYATQVWSIPPLHSDNPFAEKAAVEIGAVNLGDLRIAAKYILKGNVRGRSRLVKQIVNNMPDYGPIQVAAQEIVGGPDRYAELAAKLSDLVCVIKCRKDLGQKAASKNLPMPEEARNTEDDVRTAFAFLRLTEIVWHAVSPNQREAEHFSTNNSQMQARLDKLRQTILGTHLRTHDLVDLDKFRLQQFLGPMWREWEGALRGYPFANNADLFDRTRVRNPFLQYIESSQT